MGDQNIDFESLLYSVNNVVKDAGRAIIEIYNSADLGVEYKDDKSPLTLADKAAHQKLQKGLEALNVGPILSEEGAHISWAERSKWTQYWLVDPLDGTKEFIKRNGEFTVNVALIQNGVPVLGSVFAPDKNILYYGAAGLGAYKKLASDEGDGAKISVASLPQESDTWKIVGSRSHQSEEFKQFVEAFSLCEIVSMGSSLKLCLVAEGAADLYPRLGLTSEWDTAAAQAIVEASGGKVIDWETREPLRYNTKESLLNPFFIVCADISPLWYK